MTQKERKSLVVNACVVAGTTLKYIPEGEDAPRNALAIAGKWVNGCASKEEVTMAAGEANKTACRIASEGGTIPEVIPKPCQMLNHWSKVWVPAPENEAALRAAACYAAEAASAVAWLCLEDVDGWAYPIAFAHMYGMTSCSAFFPGSPVTLMKDPIFDTQED